jgi:hypothetical protein
MLGHDGLVIIGRVAGALVIGAMTPRFRRSALVPAGTCTPPWCRGRPSVVNYPMLPANRSASRWRRNASTTKSTKTRVLAGNSVRLA